MEEGELGLGQTPTSRHGLRRPGNALAIVRLAPTLQPGIWPRPPSASRVLGRVAAFLGPSGALRLAPAWHPLGARPLLTQVTSPQRRPRDGQRPAPVRSSCGRERVQKAHLPTCSGGSRPPGTLAAPLDACSPLLTPPQPRDGPDSPSVMTAPQSSCQMARGHPCRLDICTEDVF